MREPRVIVRGFDRPNIWLSVETFYEQTEKHNALLDHVVNSHKPGILYVATRKLKRKLQPPWATRASKPFIITLV